MAKKPAPAKRSAKLETGLSHLRNLTPDPQNARKHSPRNIGTIVDALHQVGAARSIVIDEDGVILAGNATAEAAAEAGITKVRIVDADGQTVIAVRRTGLTAKQKASLALYDNRAAELADGWDTDVLKALQAEGVDLSGLWHEDELAELLAETAPVQGLTDPDDVPAERATDIKLGDLFQLGKHRLLCGDATKAEDVARLLDGAVPFLMVTDPPYGVEYDATWRDGVGDFQDPKRRGKVANDDRIDWTPAWELFPGSVAYVWHAGVYAAEVATSLFAAKFQIRAQIVWRKQHFVFGRGHYHWQHEPAWYAVRKGSSSAKWGGDRTQSTCWDIQNANPMGGKNPDDGDNTSHGTQKPVECMERPIRNHGGPDDAVYEPFSGSGTTLIAAERQQRQCFAIEITPAYVQMAIDRWEAFTGLKAEKLAELSHA